MFHVIVSEQGCWRCRLYEAAQVVEKSSRKIEKSKNRKIEKLKNRKIDKC